MTVSEKKRNRAYVRYVHIHKDDVDRFSAFLKTVPCDRIIPPIHIKLDTHIFKLKLKKEEELYIELAFNANIKKAKARMVKVAYGNYAWRTITE